MPEYLNLSYYESKICICCSVLIQGHTFYLLVFGYHHLLLLQECKILSSSLDKPSYRLLLFIQNTGVMVISLAPQFGHVTPLFPSHHRSSSLSHQIQYSHLHFPYPPWPFLTLVIFCHSVAKDYFMTSQPMMSISITHMLNFQINTFMLFAMLHLRFGKSSLLNICKVSS